ncbi:hypothetical protein ACFCYC_28035 [Streptomyces sp. NPDC056402]|uniref:hypothetical protein n=1 Tax=Streptomyces sp. NPDC056402 TaxID=3345810 RepID=UPI0035D9CDED
MPSDELHEGGDRAGDRALAQQRPVGVVARDAPLAVRQDVDGPEVGALAGEPGEVAQRVGVVVQDEGAGALGTDGVEQVSHPVRVDGAGGRALHGAEADDLTDGPRVWSRTLHGGTRRFQPHPTASAIRGAGQETC